MTAGADLPGGTVTFLFTDIEGSTRLVRDLRGAYAEVRAAHRRLLRVAFARFGGHEIDTGTVRRAAAAAVERRLPAPLR